MKNMRWATAAIPVLLCAGGCIGMPNGGVYSLNPTPISQISQNHESGLPLGVVVDYVAIPEVVDRPEFVLRINPLQVRVVETARWSEPLKTQIASVLTVDLKRMLRVPPGVKPHTHDVPTFRIAINVQTFDLRLGEGAVLSVEWSILTPDSKRVLNGRSIVLQRVGRESFDGLVDAQSRALAAVSGDMADAIMSALQKKSHAPGRIYDVRSNQPLPAADMDATAHSKAET
ncbi:PqiC family protein [Paraburkholderia sp. SOS3]|jgi:uncharacterized lipoprotein YmbA|uniref:PqiC family protein n=1 Tax=Paraburkholderia sp. SOS3 TaxID=1926494 RepID=UPI0009F99134|nr:PqiC family protein [Paraburkholderia sp. SOS3]